MREYGITVDIHDPWVDAEEAQREYGLTIVEATGKGSYDAMILAVPHDEFRAMGVEALRAFGRPEHVLYDLKCLLAANESNLRL